MWDETPETSHDHICGWLSALASLLLISFIQSEQLSELAAILLLALMPNKIKWRHTLLSATQVNNEDLDHQLGPKTLTALPKPLELIYPGFDAGSATAPAVPRSIATDNLPAMIEAPFVKMGTYNEKFNLRGKGFCR